MVLSAKINPKQKQKNSPLSRKSARDSFLSCKPGPELQLPVTSLYDNEALCPAVAVRVDVLKVTFLSPCL